MINDKEIRDAVERVKKMHIEKLEEVEVYASGTKNDADALRMLLDLAQSYLKAGKEMPEKLKCPDHEEVFDSACMTCIVVDDMNKVRERCTLAYMKREAEWGKKLDEIKEVIKKYVLTRPIAGDWDGTRALYLNNMCVDGLIKLIREHLMGDK